MLQYLRKFIQYSVLISSLILFPLLNLYGIALTVYQPGLAGLLAYQENLYNVGIIKNAKTWPLVLILDKFFGLLSVPIELLVKFLGQFQGVPWTLTMFGYTISDPLAVISVTLADRDISLAFIGGAVIPLVLAVLLGKVFCGWICPMHTILELNLRLRKFLNKKKLPIKNLSFSRRWKYIMLLVSLIMAALGVQIFPYVLPYVQLGRNAFYWLYYGAFSFGLSMLIFIFLFELLLSERGWCRYFCPSGAFLQLVSKNKILNVTHNLDKCILGCKRCSNICELQLDTKSNFKKECTNCGCCVSACPRGALSFKL